MCSKYYSRTRDARVGNTETFVYLLVELWVCVCVCLMFATIPQPTTFALIVAWWVAVRIKQKHPRELLSQACVCMCVCVHRACVDIPIKRILRIASCAPVFAYLDVSITHIAHTRPTCRSIKSITAGIRALHTHDAHTHTTAAAVRVAAAEVTLGIYEIPLTSGARALVHAICATL